MHSPPCVRGWRTDIKIMYSSMRRRAPGGLAHRFQDQQKFIYQPSQVNYPFSAYAMGLRLVINITCSFMHRRAPGGGAYI